MTSVVYIRTEETKRKISIAHTGIPRGPHTEETKKKMRKPRSEEAKKNMRKPKIPQTKEHKRKRVKARMKTDGYKWTEESKKKNRISVLKHIKLVGGPSLGRNESEILNHLEQLYQHKISRQVMFIGYSVDGYIQELNLVIEIDEPGHYKNKSDWKDVPSFYKTSKFEKTERGKKRQKEIKEETGCTFLRINEQKFLKEMKGGIK